MFTNEYVAHDDIIKFKLDELINKYQNTTASYEHHWIVNRQTQSWLIPIKQLNNYETLWIFHYNDTNIEVKLYKAEDGWDLTSIAQNPFNNQEIIHSLREALKVLDNTNIIYSTKKEISVEEDNTPKVNIKKTVRRKINYLDILTAMIVAIIIFFMVNDYNFTSRDKNDDNKTATKVQTVQSKYNICIARFGGIYLSNSKDLREQTEVVKSYKQITTCNVDKYGNLYWIDRTNEGLYKANIDGTNAKKIMTLPILATGLAIDNIHERVFSAQWNPKKKHHEIVYSDLSGNNKTILFSNRELLRSVGGMFYDYVQDRLYVSDLTKKQIISIDVKTKKLTKIAYSNRPEDIVIDYKNKRIIWADSNVYSANLDGSDKKILISSNGEKRTSGTLTIDTINNHLIYGYRVNISGSDYRQNNKQIIEIANLDGTQRSKLTNSPFKSLSFFNNNFIVSGKTMANREVVVQNQDNSQNIPNLKSCFACHGKDWSQPALGKSLIVKNMSKKNIARALKGYKNGTYGGPLKAVMKGQVARYTDKELDAIAQAIKHHNN